MSRVKGTEKRIVVIILALLLIAVGLSWPASAETEPIRVIHYINQFYAGIGGEEKADTPPAIQEGTVGPAMALKGALGEDGEVVATIYCGDDYMASNTDEALEQILAWIDEYDVDLVVAGPAFNAERYGNACGAVAVACEQRLGIPAITGMYEENPAVETYGDQVYIVPTKNSAAGMRTAIPAMADLGLKYVRGEELGEDNVYLGSGPTPPHKKGNITVKKTWDDGLTGEDAESRPAPEVTVKVTLTKTQLLDIYYPAGSYYETFDASFDPNESFVGTWKLETEGQVHMTGSIGNANANGGAGATDGGSKDTILAVHTHSLPAMSAGTSTNGNHDHTFSYRANIATGGNYSCDQLLAWNSPSATRTTNTSSSGNHQHSGATNATSTGYTGVDATNTNMMPYANVYRWHRVE